MKVRTCPHQVLRQRCEPVDDPTHLWVITLAQEMLRVMRLGGGIGLAAPQVGVPIRMVVVESTGPRIGAMVLVNPEFHPLDEGHQHDEERCLSLPEQSFNVRRWESGTLCYANVLGHAVVRKVSGLLARVVQHELDHLDGRLIVDHE